MATSMCRRLSKISATYVRVLALPSFESTNRPFHTSDTVLKSRKHKSVPKPKKKDKGEEIVKVWAPYALRNKTQILEPDPVWLENFNAQRPEDDIWLHQYYPKKEYLFTEALHMHAELAHPQMTDNMDSLVYLDLELDMRTKKKTKFAGAISNTLVLPHSFDDGTYMKVIAFCRTIEEQTVAEKEGAEFYGSHDLVKKMEKGAIHNEEFDVVVTTADMLPDIMSLRKLLRDKFPAKNKKTVKSYVQGKSYKSEVKTPAVHKLRVCLGNLKMTPQQLQENFQSYLEDVCLKRNEFVRAEKYITSAALSCPHSPEVIKLKGSETVPISVQEQLALEALEAEEAAEQAKLQAEG